MKSDRDKEFDEFIQSKLEGIQSPDTFDEQWKRMEAVENVVWVAKLRVDLHALEDEGYMESISFEKSIAMK